MLKNCDDCKIELLESRSLFTAVVITGTSGNDTIYVTLDSNPNYIDFEVNGVVTKYSAVRSVSISGGDGVDSIQMQNSQVTVPTTINGGNGNDGIVGPSGPSTLSGDAGNDGITNFSDNYITYMYGGSGDDTIGGLGRTSTEYVFGGIGSDTLYAYGSGYNGSASTHYYYQNNSSNSADGSVDNITIKNSSGVVNHYFLSSADGDTVSSI